MSNSPPNYLSWSWDEERAKWKEGSGVKVIWQAAERHQAGSTQSEVLLHPLCWKIRFPLFSQGQRPGNISGSAEAQSLPAPALHHLSATPEHRNGHNTKLEQGMVNACKKKAARAESLSLFILKSHERQEGPKMTPAKPSGHMDNPELLPKVTSRQVRGVWLLTGRREGLGSTNPARLWQGSSSKSVHNQVGALGEVCETPAPGSGATCAVLNPSYSTASTTNQLHAGFFSSKPSWMASISLKYVCSNDFSHACAFPGFYPPSVLTDPP